MMIVTEPFESERAVGELVVDHRSANGAVVRSFRGALLMAYIERLKAQEHYPRYLAALSTVHREELTCITALSWVPAELVLAHFEACDGLDLPEREVVEQGYLAGKSASPVMLGTLVRLTGLTPLTALHALGRVWDRIYEGGTCIALRTGPKDVFIEQRGNPAARSRFYRLAGRGFYRALAEVFCTRAYVRDERSRTPGPHAFAVTVSWV
jgi:hypothetical protein